MYGLGVSLTGHGPIGIVKNISGLVFFPPPAIRINVLSFCSIGHFVGFLSLLTVK